MFDILFYLLLFVLFISGRYYLDDMLYDNLQDLEEQDFEQLGDKGKCLDHVDPMFSLTLYTDMHLI
jgi:hypothetical protein